MAEVAFPGIQKKVDSRFQQDDNYEFQLPNVEVYYTYFFEPDTKYNPCWKCEIILPESVARSMAEVGFNIKKKVYSEGEDEKYFIVAKRKTHTSKGKAMYPPRVFDSGSEQLKPQLWPSDVLIGNGSVCNINVGAKYVTVNGSTNLPLYLNSVQVVKHVAYGGSPFQSVVDGGGDKPSFL